MTSWYNESYYFTKLPDYLVGVNFFRIPNYLNVTKNSSFELSIYRPSTVFIFWYDTKDGDISNRLPNEGWKRLSEVLSTSWSNLGNAYMKSFNQYEPITISFGEMDDNYLRGIIFVRGIIN